MEYNETNLIKQKTLRKENASTASAASKAQKGGTKDVGGGSTRGTRKDGPRGTKRGREEVGARTSLCVLLIHVFLHQDDSSKKPELKLDLPEILKQVLVNDWECVTKDKKVRSPHSYPS